MADTDNGQTPAQDAPDAPRIAPGGIDDSQSLWRIANAAESIQALLERIVAAGEDEATATAKLLGGLGDLVIDEPVGDMGELVLLNSDEMERPLVRLDDMELVAAHWRNRDGTYGINDPHTGQKRAAVPDEVARLDRLVGRGRSR